MVIDTIMKNYHLRKRGLSCNTILKKIKKKEQTSPNWPWQELEILAGFKLELSQFMKQIT